MIVAANEAPDYYEMYCDGHNIQPYDFYGTESISFGGSVEVSLDKVDPVSGNVDNGSIGRHDSVVRLRTDQLLVLYTSQWDGKHDMAEFTTLEKLEAHCKYRKIDYQDIISRLYPERGVE